MASFDGAQLPRQPLSMGLLLSLEPPELRRLLKSGLRLGLAPPELEQLLRQDWGLETGSPEADTLLAALAERDWFRWNPQAERWKTHLG